MDADELGGDDRAPAHLGGDDRAPAHLGRLTTAPHLPSDGRTTRSRASSGG